MVGFIIELFVGPQSFQHRNADGGKQTVGPDDDQKHRNKVHRQRCHGGAGGDGNGIPRPQSRDADDRRHVAGLRLPFPRAALPQQLHGVLNTDAVQIYQKVKQQDRAEQHGRPRDGGAGDIEAVDNIHPHHAAQQEHRQLLQQYTQQHAAHDTRGGGVDHLEAQNNGNVPLAHAQNVVKSQLPFAPFHQEAVGIGQKNDRENGDDKGADIHEHGEVSIPGAVWQIGRGRQRHRNIIGRRRPHDGQQVWNVKLPVSGQIHQGHPGIEPPLIHLPHRLAPAPSACRKCGQTAAPAYSHPDRAGGTPPRPVKTGPVERGWRP
ncbi:hypothetical protein SDC9_115243 [bioreactor metagenome]|uniref:Uncharacterized protein n=1 Tax=bioreactor metagenome TaxID=1076179 RepID=A0A645BSU4_9ZZZZ